MKHLLFRSLLATGLVLTATVAGAATLHVSPTGSDSGDCKSAPCKTIAKGIASMSAGDTLMIADGTYAEPVKGMPNGSAAAYTQILAEHDWGVTIDGTGFANDFTNGIDAANKSYVRIRGFRVKMNQSKENNQPVVVPYADHVKIERCSGSGAPVTGNASTFAVGPTSKFVTLEECHAYGGGRYQFLVYQSENIIVRRSVARSDYWNGTLQCAGFTNYDSKNTAWQNDIVIDSDTATCAGRMFGGFFSENKEDFQPDTSQRLDGNIVLNVNAFYAGDLDWVTTGKRVINDMIIWGSVGGYHSNKGPGDAASLTVNRFTIGGSTGKYDGANDGPARGTGVSVYGDSSQLTNTVSNSIFADNASLGVADYTTSAFNAFSGNGANYGGDAKKAVKGATDRSSENGNALDVKASGLKYLPRIEPGSALKTAGQDGSQIGAEVMIKVGADGSLQDDPSWDKPTGELLWPYPNEDEIRSAFASYSGPGGTGARGFAAGNSKDGTPQTLTKYVWEYLGNQIPDDVYGFHITVGALPAATINVIYSATIGAAGGKGPYTITLDGALPAGLTFDAGVISGTPTVLGTSTFDVTAKDSSEPQNTATKTLALVVGTDPPAGSSSGGTSVPDGGVVPNAAAAGDDDSGCSSTSGPLSPGVLFPLATVMLAFVLARRRRT